VTKTSLTEQLRSGNRLALARILTQVENDTPTGQLALDELFPFTGKAHLVGITGSPGTGKSSLANQLARLLRQKKDQAPIAILAVDPTSPFSGGALLGDRIRMRDLSGDPGIFIRSMASRGALGGLARTTSALVQVLDAAGFDWILIETVGAGQSEVEVARLAHTTVVVEAPGLGDDIQAIKAGILEIADILVVNKADLAGVENTERALRASLEMAHDENNGNKPVWKPILLRTEATRGIGVDAVLDAILAHRKFLESSGDWKTRERSRLQAELDSLIVQSLYRQWQNSPDAHQYQDLLQKVWAHELSPTHAASQVTGEI
jgi:LAO/AO transport system kinase